MTPINNSDTAWLIVSDFNQENGKFYEDLREDICNPNINEWEFEYLFNESNGGTISELVGGIMSIRVGINGASDSVGGSRYSNIGGGATSEYVGGATEELGSHLYPYTGQLVGGHDPNQQLRHRLANRS